MIEPVSDSSPFSLFDDIDDWLTDASVYTGPTEQPAAQGFFVLQDAIARASQHQGCTPDSRRLTFLVGVTGQDSRPTIQSLGPADAPNAHCVLGELRRHEQAVEVRIVGVELPEPDPQA